MWRHSRGTSWSAGARLRGAVAYQLRREFCVVELAEQDVQRARPPSRVAPPIRVRTALSAGRERMPA